MKHVLILSILFFRVSSIWSSPLPVRTNHTVIIDTDCAFDDMRTISLLLSRPEITINAFLLSDGSLPPDEGFEKVSSLLNEFNRDTIPIALGETFKEINPPWRPFVRQIIWGKKIGQQPPESDAPGFLYEKLNRSNEKITLICLGTLTNIYQVIKKDAIIKSKIERIIWYNNSIGPFEGFNYECDTSAVDFIFKSGIRVDVISNLLKEEAIVDTSFYSVCEQSDNILSHVLFNTLSQPAVSERLNHHHFKLCDDLIAVYITNPELFDINTLKENISVRFNQDYDVISVKEAIHDMIKGTYTSGKSIVFNDFPRKREMFTYDVRQIMDSVIRKYGLDEWKANVMTDEFHGHLGVFSIVGVKMGIKAREIFGAAPDQLEVITFAGSKPPYSCLNDGIQVSTGATLGMGTIHLAEDDIAKPMAIFTYKNRSIQLSLKAECLKQADEDINEGIVKFGLMDDGYWKLVRRNAIFYWLHWDRDKIFDIIEISNKQ